VAGGHHTKLDQIDYDAIYSIDRESSLEMYRQCRRFLGDAMPDRVDTFLEIGAGTGLFTLGFLANTPTRRALITDISAQMLNSCRARIERELPDQQAAITYVMWDGEQDCLRERSVDFVGGFSVLHHVLDYQGFLATLGRGMRVGGRAVFLEPNLNFHRALVDFMVDAVWHIHRDDPAWAMADRLKVYNWIGENHANLKYCGDGFVLQAREDKHLFDAEKLCAAARDAGFAGARIIPYGDRNEAWTTICVYVHQMDISHDARLDLLKRCARMLPGPFEHLAAIDRAPSFLLVLDKADAQPEAGLQGRAPALASALPDPDPMFFYQMSFAVGAAPQASVEAGGWILGDIEVRFLCLDVQGTRLRFAVHGIRADVDGAINAGREYPPLRSLFPGLVNVCEQHVDLSGDATMAVVVAVGMDGQQYRLGEVSLAAGSTARLEAHNVRPLSISAAAA
jgi:ubiquinone/menaquinone biosynthesis C-methylase UbiE